MSGAAVAAALRPSRTWLLAGSLALLAVLRLLTLGLYPLADMTESRYAEIARRMAESGDWVTPWLDAGVPFWGKPPLHTWLSALGLQAFGLHEWAVRVPHFLCGVLVAWLLWRWMRRERPREALPATVMLASAALFFVSSGAVMTEASLLVGAMAVMRGFWAGLHGAPGGAARERWLLFGGLAVGLLAKGPVVVVLSTLPLLAWTVATGRWREVWQKLPWWRGSLLVLAIAAPWYLLAESRTPGFLHYFFVGEHWQRFTVPGWQGDLYGGAHAEPRGTIWLFALAAFLPWSLLLPLMALGRRAHQTAPAPASDRDWRVYLWAWALAPLVFFTMSRNILWTYVLTGLPAMAMLAAGWLARDRRQQHQHSLLAAGVLATSLIFLGLLLAPGVAGRVRSAKGVIEAIDRRGDSLARLAVVGNRHYSAAFYSRGQVRRIDDAALADWATGGDGAAAAGIDQVALLDEQRDALPAPVRAGLQEQGQFGRYVLYARRPR